MSTFEDFATAIRMRTLMKGIIKEEVDYLRPADKFGIVYSIDELNKTALVILDGDVLPIKVRYDLNNAPISSQQVPHYGLDGGDANRVRVSGGPGGYWITQIIRGHSSVARYDTQPGFRNFIINGACDVAQRGEGPFTTDNKCGIDQWVMNKGGAATVSVTRQTHTPGASPGTRYYAQIDISNSTGTGDYGLVGFKIEDVTKFDNEVVTLSFDAWAGSGTPAIGIEVSQVFGAGGSAQVTMPVKAVTIQQDTVKRYYVTFQMPSISGKTVSTGTDTYTLVYMWLTAGTVVASRASYIGHQNNSFRITNVQFELGPIATPFERLPVDVTLARCMRYYEQVTLGGYVAAPINNNVYRTSYFRVKKRATPAITIVSEAGIDNYVPGHSSFEYISVDMVSIISAVNASGFPYNALSMTYGASAEL